MPGPLPAADQLGQWLDWTDAIALSAALAGAPSPPAHGAPTQGPAHSPALEQARRVRTELERLIDTDTGLAHPSGDTAHARATYRLHQRTMGERLATVRAKLRAELAARPGPGAELAALDAVLERALLRQEKQALAQVPALLDRHLAQVASPDAEPAPPGDSLWQQTLRAELHTRWQPVAALIEVLEAASAAPSSPSP
jgi:hypothetical protein